ncbi:MAG: SDR family oxidoreductase [Elainellaceae cyanobacterium]
MSETIYPLKNQTAIVTGGDSGIGEGVVRQLAKAGAQVAINYHSNADAAAKIISDLEADGGKAIAIQADVSQEDQVLAMFNQLCDRSGSFDILVANAGLQKDAALTEMTLSDWEKVIGVNLTGQFLCCREAAKQFVQQGVRPDVSQAAGKIICMRSVHQVIPWTGHVNYASSKGGINMMMQSMAQELAAQKIRVNSIAPGAIKTPINRVVWDTPEALDDLLKLIPYGRIGDPDDIGKAAVWLASDASDYVTGTTLFVDGGMTLYPGFQGNG